MSPIADQNGITSIFVEVDDGTTITVQGFDQLVNAVNDPPIISDIPNQLTAMDTALGPVAYSVNDVDNVLNCAADVSFSSSNTLLLPLANMSTSGSEPNCTFTITPATGEIGT